MIDGEDDLGCRFRPMAIAMADISVNGARSNRCSPSDHSQRVWSTRE